MAAQKIIVRIFRGTWQKRSGVSMEYALSRSALQRFGLRVVVHQWTGESVVTVRCVTGNAWRDPANFRELDATICTAKEADRRAREMLQRQLQKGP